MSDALRSAGLDPEHLWDSAVQQSPKDTGVEHAEIVARILVDAAAGCGHRTDSVTFTSATMSLMVCPTALTSPSAQVQPSSVGHVVRITGWVTNPDSSVVVQHADGNFVARADDQGMLLWGRVPCGVVTFRVETDAVPHTVLTPEIEL